MRALIALLLAAALPLHCGAAERVCDQSDSEVVAAPGGKVAASVQHQVCSAGDAAGAAITVYVGPAPSPLEGERVVATAVPRSKEEWPRAVWRGDSLLEVWVPNFAQVLEAKPSAGPVTVKLAYCGDDPQARERVARHAEDIRRWQREVTAWAQRRKADPEAAGPRPARPEEPRVARRPCQPGDIPP